MLRATVAKFPHYLKCVCTPLGQKLQKTHFYKNSIKSGSVRDQFK